MERSSRTDSVFDKRLPKRDLTLMSPTPQLFAPAHAVVPLAKVLLAGKTESGVCLPRTPTSGPKCPISPLVAGSNRVIVDTRRCFFTSPSVAEPSFAAA